MSDRDALWSALKLLDNMSGANPQGRTKLRHAYHYLKNQEEHGPRPPLFQWCIVRDNFETYIAWAETEALALAEFHSKGYSDEWRVLKAPGVML